MMQKNQALAQDEKEQGALAEQLVAIELKCQEYLQGWQRAQADYANLKKNTDKEKEEWAKFANQALLLRLLPIYDHLKLAILHVPAEQKQADWVVGVANIKNQFAKFLAEAGVEEIKTIGEKFNPEEHEALAVSENKDDEIVSEELHPGYKLNGKVLYPAKVKI